MTRDFPGVTYLRVVLVHRFNFNQIIPLFFPKLCKPLHIKELEKEKQNPKPAKRKKITKIRAEVNDTEARINNRSIKPGANSLKKSELINFHPNSTKRKKRERTQISKIINEEDK